MYFLVDGIYPPWAIFINTFHGNELEEKQRRFASVQEGARKDIERCFGVLVQRFQILAHPLRNFFWDDVVDILDCCIILHNMVVENRRPLFATGANAAAAAAAAATNDIPAFSLFGTDNDDPTLVANLQQAEIRSMQMAALSERMKSRDEHHSLKNDLVEHIWNNYRN
jgi:hypothetical protein